MEKRDHDLILNLVTPIGLITISPFYTTNKTRNVIHINEMDVNNREKFEITSIPDSR